MNVERVTMPGNFLGALVKGGRLLFNRLKEKPEVKVDEYALEHMLVYHGLVGSSPENQRDFRDVRADILEAIRHRSSLQLAIALRLPPLYWEDKLITIFSELPQETRASVADLLVPDDQGGTLAPGANPIKHDDWRVRANAAAIASYLHSEKAATILGGVLGDSSSGGRLASCYVAYALGKLRSEAARHELIKNKDVEEPWLRVDIAGALALSDFRDVAGTLSEMLMNETETRDYMSVAIVKQHKPRLFLEHSDTKVKSGGVLLILGILDAVQHSFTDALVFETGVYELVSTVVDLAVKEHGILPIAAALQMVDWAEKYCEDPASSSPEKVSRSYEPSPSELAKLPSEKELSSAREKLTSEQIKSAVTQELATLLKKEGTGRPDAELLFAIQLAGRLTLTDSQEVLLSSLHKDYPLRDAIIEAIGALHQEKSTEALIAFAKSLIDVDLRNSNEKSKQPVAEDDLAASKTYWSILKALGGIATASSAKFLLAATNDFAPDKRAQALESLVSVLAKDDTIQFAVRIDDVLRAALSDSAPMMQLAAVAGVAKLNRTALISEVAQLIDANENTVSKDVFEALRRLSEEGSSVAVAGVLNEKLRTTKDALKRQRIEQILASKFKN
jgi:hypothetical protein